MCALSFTRFISLYLNTSRLSYTLSNSLQTCVCRQRPDAMSCETFMREAVNLPETVSGIGAARRRGTRLRD